MFKKILIYGENWPGTLPRLLHDDLLKRGYEVKVFDFTDFIPGYRNRDFFQKVRRRLFPSYYADKVRKLFLDDVLCFSPDIVIVSKGLHLDGGSLEKIKSKGIPLINWNPDDFFNLRNSSASLLAAMPQYDLIVSSRAHLFPKYQDHGVRNLLYLDWYYVPELHFDHGGAKTIGASFVGSWSPTREKFIGGLNKSFKIWGGGWEKSASRFARRHDVQHKTLSQVEMSRVFTGSQYNLNLLTHENSDLSNLRFFEVPASAGLLLTERNAFADKYLIDREECLMFSSSDEVNDIFSQDFDLEKIARNGHRRISNSANSFSSRVDELIAYLKAHL